MKSEVKKSERTDRGLDLEKLWEGREEEAPGTIRSLPKNDRGEDEATVSTKSSK
jgi:hypothetical protein